jgi:hypothetical protein
MEKYIFIHENPKSTPGVNNVVAVVGTMELLDYNVELVSDIPAFQTYLFDDTASSGGHININLLLSTALQVDKVDTAKKFMDSFQSSFEHLYTTFESVVDFYPPQGIVMGTVSA